MKAFTLAAGALTALSLIAGGATTANATPAPAPKTTTVDITPSTGANSGYIYAPKAAGYLSGTALVSYASGATWSTTVPSGSTVTLYGTVFKSGARVQVLVDGKQVSWADSYRAQNPTNPYKQAITTTTVPNDGKTHRIAYRSLTTGASRSVLALDFITVTAPTTAPMPTPAPNAYPVSPSVGDTSKVPLSTLQKTKDDEAGTIARTPAYLTALAQSVAYFDGMLANPPAWWQPQNEKAIRDARARTLQSIAERKDLVTAYQKDTALLDQAIALRTKHCAAKTVNAALCA